MVRIIPSLAIIPVLASDIVILLFFTWLNQFNLKTGTKITYTFIVLKFTPILFAICASLYLLNYWSMPADTLLWSGIPMTIPLVLYAFVGFEVACSLSNSIENPQRNAPRAILYSFGIVILITVLYQLLLFAAVGKQLMHAESFLDIFPILFKAITTPSAFTAHILNLLYIASACAALGGSYGILLSNAWNLHVLAKNNHIWYANAFNHLNQYGIPFACILAQTAICLLYFFATFGHQITLQQISVFGCTIAYTLSVLGLLHTRKSFLALCALGSCGVLLSMCIRNFILSPSISLVLFGIFLVIGCIMFFAQRK
jgi:amino acid transporter